MRGRSDGWRLHGFINPVGLVPAFLLPVFTTARSNYLFVQEIGADDRITRFHPLDTGEHEIVRTPDRGAVEPGAEALWGFQRFEQQWLVGTRDELRTLIESTDTNDLPMLALQTARFLGADLIPATANCYHSLMQRSTATARLWRDLAILTPEFRKRAAAQLPVQSTAHGELARLIVRSDGRDVIVRAPPQLLNAIGGVLTWRTLLEEARELLSAVGVNTIDVEAIRDNVKAKVAAKPHTRVLLLATDKVAAGLAVIGARNARLEMIEGPLFAHDGQLAPTIRPDEDSIFLVLAEDNDRSMVVANRITQRLVGGHARVAAFVLRSAGLPGRPAADDVNEQFKSLARSAHWVAVIGGSGTGPSPSQIIKWVSRAIAQAAIDPKGRAVLELLFRTRKTPKLAVIGSGDSSGDKAGSVAVQNALRSLAQAYPTLGRIEAVGMFLFRGASAAADTIAQVKQAVREAAPEAEQHLLDITWPQLKSQVRVIVIARGRMGTYEARRAPYPVDEFREQGWRSGHALPEIDVLDAYISKGDAEYVLRSELDRSITTIEDADTIIRTTPMYRGPVALFLGAMPPPDVVNYLQSAGITCVQKGGVADLDSSEGQPIKSIREQLLRLSREEASRRVNFLIRDLVWADLSHENGNGLAAQWLFESYPEEVEIKEIDLYRVSSAKTLHFRGRGTAAPAYEHGGGVPDPVDFSFWVTMDDEGIRVTRITLRRNFDEPTLPGFS